MIGAADLQTLAEIKGLLARHQLAPNRSLGQNFLVDHNLLRKLLDAAGVAPGDLVLEVGPGTGVLTEALLERGAEVVACELDAGMVRLLRERLADPIGAGRLTLVHADCLDGKRALAPEVHAALAGRPFALVANLPYGSASPLMVTLAARRTDCTGQFVTIQKEVAGRLRAAPGSRDYSELAVLVGAACTVERVAALGPECFWPRPKVTSEMIAIRPRPSRDRPAPEELRRLDDLASRLFTRRRKQVGTILGRDVAAGAGVDPTARPEQLDVAAMLALAQCAAER